HGLPANPSDHGLTTDLPDWSFAGKQTNHGWG
ncbi:hypothetical protein E2320_003583, partial [Naja naja]